MDPSLRNTSNLVVRIEKLRDELIKHFDGLVGKAGIDKTDRNSTSILQYQMQIETAAIIRAAEDLQVLIRNLQEMWLFGQLDTLGDSKVQEKSNEDAKVVADLLGQLVERQRFTSEQNDSVTHTNGDGEKVEAEAEMTDV